MAKIVMTVELEFDPDIWIDGNESMDYFFEDILGSSDLLLFENREVGDSLGTIKILEIKESD